MSEYTPPPVNENVPPPRQKSGRWHWIVLAVVVLAAGIGIFTRMEASADLKKRTEEDAIVSVSVIKAPSVPSTEEIVLPGTVQAWHEAPIFARTSGYIQSWKTDIGAHVKGGDLLALIEAPEVDAQLHQAQADLATAQANNTLAQITAVRWKALLKTQSVSKQETDEKIGAASANSALVAAAKANVDRLRQLESFKRVVAPFDGIVTARNTDTGALINAGSSTAASGQELFHVADLHRLRIYVQVPETYTPAVTSDLVAELHFTEHPGKVYTAKLNQKADALDPTTRTLLVQFAFDNGKGELLPGGYADVHLKLPSENNAVRLPVNTLLFRSDGLQIATVNENGTAELRPIKIARDFGKEVEVADGVQPGESIIINPPDSLTGGEKVHVLASKADEKNSIEAPKTETKEKVANENK